MSLWRRLGWRLWRRDRVEADPDAIVFFVRCDACHEIIRVRADRRWDLIAEYGDPEVAQALHKDVLGARCNRMMSIHVAFDRRGAILRQDAEGASFVTPGDRPAEQAGREEP